MESHSQNNVLHYPIIIAARPFEEYEREPKFDRYERNAVADFIRAKLGGDCYARLETRAYEEFKGYCADETEADALCFVFDDYGCDESIELLPTRFGELMGCLWRKIETDLFRKCADEIGFEYDDAMIWRMYYRSVLARPMLNGVIGVEYDDM